MAALTAALAVVATTESRLGVGSGGSSGRAIAGRKLTRTTGAAAEAASAAIPMRNAASLMSSCAATQSAAGTPPRSPAPSHHSTGQSRATDRISGAATTVGSDTDGFARVKSMRGVRLVEQWQPGRRLRSGWEIVGPSLGAPGYSQAAATLDAAPRS